MMGFGPTHLREEFQREGGGGRSRGGPWKGIDQILLVLDASAEAEAN